MDNTLIWISLNAKFLINSIGTTLKDNTLIWISVNVKFAKKSDLEGQHFHLDFSKC